MLIGIFQIMLMTAFGQRVFMVEKPGTVNNLKYNIGDRIELKTNKGERISGMINQLSDSSIVVNYNYVKIEDILIVYTRRYVFSILSAAGTTGGLAYVSIDAFNNLINNQDEIFRKSTLKTGSIMFGTGLLLKLISKRKRHINNEDWRIKVLDFSILKDPGIYTNPVNVKHE
jgi:hypothetical protein